MLAYCLLDATACSLVSVYICILKLARTRQPGLIWSTVRAAYYAIDADVLFPYFNFVIVSIEALVFWSENQSICFGLGFMKIARSLVFDLILLPVFHVLQVTCNEAFFLSMSSLLYLVVYFS